MNNGLIVLLLLDKSPFHVFFFYIRIMNVFSSLVPRLYGPAFFLGTRLCVLYIA